jgi:tetratricopeptide (TPR) repeat protein
MKLYFKRIRVNLNTITLTGFCYMTERRHYILITIVITLYLLTSCEAGPGDATTAKLEADPAEISKAVTDAETLFANRGTGIEHLEKAVKLLSDVRSPDHRNFDIEWRYAKMNYFLGKESTSETNAIAAFEKGRDAGRIASRIAPDRPDGYFWYGANLGELARISPVTVGMKSVDDVRAALNKVIELQPDYQNASAYDGLAQLELATRLYGGSAERAAELLETGLKFEKNNPNIHLHLAEAYLALNRSADARKQLDLLEQMKPNPSYIPEYNECIARAKHLRETRF